MNKALQYSLIGVLGVGLLLIRHFESDLFYDPFIAFFKGEFYFFGLPDFTWSSLIYSLGFRFALNTVLSLGILYLIFRDKRIVKVAASIYAICFILLLLVFVALLASDDPWLNALFYVRRFLIQPVLLLLFIPAFYYHKLNN